jgi:hypothetical protein
MYAMKEDVTFLTNACRSGSCVKEDDIKNEERRCNSNTDHLEAMIDPQLCLSISSLKMDEHIYRMVIWKSRKPLGL